MSSPTVHTFQPSMALGGMSMAKLVLPQAEGNAAATIGLLALGAFDAENEHVLGHPALVARDVAGDAQSKALLAQQGVAAVTRAIRPDLAALGKMDDVFCFVAGPGNVLLAGFERHADGVHAGHNAFHILVDLGEDRCADAGHDAHLRNNVG